MFPVSTTYCTCSLIKECPPPLLTVFGSTQWATPVSLSAWGQYWYQCFHHCQVYWGLYRLTNINPRNATVLLKLLWHLSTYKCRSKPRLLWTVMNANNGQVQIYKHGWMNIRTLWKAAIPCWFRWTYKFDYYGVWSVSIVHVLSLCRLYKEPEKMSFQRKILNRLQTE